MFSSLRQDWATPRALFEILDREFRFALDACATAETACCARWFEREALLPESSWAPGPVWMNPPFRGIAAWVERACREARAGVVVVCLLPSRTDTSWWHDYVMPFGELRFLRGRLSFDDRRRGRAPFPSVVVVFRPEHFRSRLKWEDLGVALASR